MDKIIEEWCAIASYHRTAAAKAEAHIKELIRSEKHITPIILAMAPDDAKWKKVIEEDHLIENVLDILKDCRYAIDTSNFPGHVEMIHQLDNPNNIKWDEFCLRVIQHMKLDGAFGSFERGYDNFSDTGNGCDEIAWQSVAYLIEHPEWMPPA